MPSTARSFHTPRQVPSSCSSPLLYPSHTEVDPSNSRIVRDRERKHAKRPSPSLSIPPSPPFAQHGMSLELHATLLNLLQSDIKRPSSPGTPTPAGGASSAFAVARPHGANAVRYVSPHICPPAPSIDNIDIHTLRENGTDLQSTSTSGT